MNIIAHRGFWVSEAEKNSPLAFQRALEHGFGIETDIRDFQGALVISHDIPNASCQTVEDFFKQCISFTHGTLALNIKSDGLQAPLQALLARYHIQNYFVFDMSIPDAMGYLRQDMVAFTRQSDHEPTPFLYEKSAGVWMDEFTSHWITPAAIQAHFDKGKKVAIVSPELHRRTYEAEWNEYLWLKDRPLALLCTDFPDKAKRMFFS